MSSGYAGKILRIDLSSRGITETYTMDYATRFLGGRGIGAKIYWDEVMPVVNALDPQNILVFAVGPLAGLPVLGGSRCQVCGKSPMRTPQQFCYGNFGGRWGAELKFAGYDGMVVLGKSENPVYLSLHDDTIDFKDAHTLWGKGAIETREILKSELGESAKVVAIGPAGENMVTTATLLADGDASASAGLGAVMGSKGLKAIVIQSTEKRIEVTRPDRFAELIRYFRGLKRIPISASIYRYSTDAVPSLSDKMKRAPCYGCLGCFRKSYHAQDGTTGKYMCHSAMFYQPWAIRYYGGWNEVPFYATKLIDDYGLDSWATDLVISWLDRCHKAGILSDQSAGIPISKVGSLEFIRILAERIGFRQGFGEMLARGLDQAADAIGPEAKEQLKEIGYLSNPEDKDQYGARLYITNALIQAMEPRVPIQQLHEVGALIRKWVSWAKEGEGGIASSDVVRGIAKRFWGSELAADFSTYEGKALAAKLIQDREYAKECLILCDFLWPLVDIANSDDHVGDPRLESAIFSAVTGKDVDEQGLYKIGERVFNLQRAILVREGRRGRDFDILPDYCYSRPLEYDHVNPDCLVPGKDGEVISRIGVVVDREGFERLKDEYYELRKWDVATGLQTKAVLEGLELSDVAKELSIVQGCV
jgi:aldehyde:ferredoxin oxidoreductase